MLRFSSAIGNQLRVGKSSLTNLSVVSAPFCRINASTAGSSLKSSSLCRTNATLAFQQNSLLCVRNNVPFKVLRSHQRSLSTQAILSRAGIPNHAFNDKLRYLAFGVLVAAGVGERLYGGYNENFYEYRFITTKDPDDLMAFYGGEEFMELFCVIPLMGMLIMRGGHFDDEGTVHTTGLTGKEMLVSMVFSEEEDERDGKTAWFNKRERFREIGFLGGTNWDMIQNFGFHRLPDGRVEVYHQGEYFQGNNGPLSLLVLVVFSVHARFVAWSTKYHIVNYAFTSTCEEEEEMEELSRGNVLWHLVKNEFFGGIRNSIFGAPPRRVVEDEDEDEGDEDEEEEEEEEVLAAPVLSMARRQTIAADIAMDRQLARMNTESASPLTRKITKKLTRKNTIGGLLLAATNNPDALMQATANAMERHQTRLIRRATVKAQARHATMMAQREVVVTDSEDAPSVNDSVESNLSINSEQEMTFTADEVESAVADEVVTELQLSED
mmetsp:Transcript_48542/g.58572  ORF Transcript_48542/g.58572 Transcript_48542/m.58572 type:complete len:495 (+) Transcript_48542:141-1625(+)